MNEIKIELSEKIENDGTNPVDVKYKLFVALSKLLECLDGEYDVSGFDEKFDHLSSELVISAHIHKHKYGDKYPIKPAR